VVLETAAPGALKVNGLAAAKAPGVQTAAVNGNRIELVLGSGNYRVVAANPAERRP